MASILRERPKNANLGAVVSFPNTENSFPVFERLAAAMKALWPVKTAAHVAYLTDCSERTVRFWLARKTRMSVDAVAALLQTEDGYLILEAIMGDSKVEWWVVARVGQEVRKSRKAIKKEQERIDKTRAQLNLLDQ